MRCLAACGYKSSEGVTSRGKSKESGGEESALETISKKSTRRPGGGGGGGGGGGMGMGMGMGMGDTQLLESIDEEEDQEGDGEMHDVDLGDAADELHSRHWRPNGHEFSQLTVVQALRGETGAGDVSGDSNSIIMTREFEIDDSYVDKPMVR
jgi:hypothetical protein